MVRQPFLQAAGQSTVDDGEACTAQPQDASQSTPAAQELQPEHRTLQKPGPQLMRPAQLLSASQWMVQLVAWVQSMAPGQSPRASHCTSHG